MALTVIDKQVTYDVDFGVTVPFMSPAAGASVAIRKANGGVLAQLYSASTGGTLLNNPFTLGADARIFCYVESGKYDLEVTLAGETVTYADFQAVDDIVIEGPKGTLQFATVAEMINGNAFNQQTSKLDWANYLGQKVSTVANNTISGAGGADYIITNVNPGNLSTLVDGVWVDRNHDLGGGFYAKKWQQEVALSDNLLSSSYPNLDYSTVLQRFDDGEVTRLYVMPKGAPAGNTLGAIKVFGDDFLADPVNYRDFNITMAKSGYPVGGTYSADGAVLLNMKTLGSFRNTENPDMIFCYNDAISSAFIAGRITYEYNAGNVDLLWTFGSDIPPTNLHASTIAWFTQDMAFKNDVGMRFAGADGVYDWSFRLGADDIFHLNCNGLSDRITINASGSLDSRGRLGSKNRRMAPVSQSYSGTITPDMNDGGFRTTFLTGNPTINAPINSADGDELTFLFTADATNRSLTFNSAYKTGAYSLNVNAGTTSIFKFVRRNSTTWDLHSFTEGL